jgi:hypothetical protein
MAVFCDVGPCSLVDINRRFRGAYCLRHYLSFWWGRQEDSLKRRSVSTRLHGAVSQKAVSRLVVMRTRNLTEMLSIVVFWVVTPCGRICGHLLSPKAFSSTYNTTRRHNREDGISVERSVKLMMCNKLSSKEFVNFFKQLHNFKPDFLTVWNVLRGSHLQRTFLEK